MATNFKTGKTEVRTENAVKQVFEISALYWRNNCLTMRNGKKLQRAWNGALV
jgi:hypothetical protein